MSNQAEKQQLERIQEEARLAFDEFLRRLSDLERQRKDVVKDTLRQIDQNKIADMRRKLGLPQSE